MTTMISEEPREFFGNYGGSPPAPQNVINVRYLRTFDDGTTAWLTKENVPVADVFATWDTSMKAQRDALATQSGEQTMQIQTLTSDKEALTQQLATLQAQYDQLLAAHIQLQNEIEPVQ